MSTMRANQAVAWSLIVLAALISAAGYVFDLFEELWWFDEALHAYMVFSLALALALYAYGVVLAGARSHGVLLVLTIASMGVALGLALGGSRMGVQQNARRV